MKYLLVAVVSIMASLSSDCAGSSGSDSSQPIMHRYRVQSGQYYLISNAREPALGSDTRLFDDPQVLYRYRKQVIPVSSLSSVLGLPDAGLYVDLYNREGELLRASSRGGAIQFPQEMWASGKPLKYTETFRHMADARRRVEQLNTIEGITRAELHDSHYRSPPIAEPDYRLTIRFPLWVARSDDPQVKLHHERMLDALANTLGETLTQAGIDDWYVRAKRVQIWAKEQVPGYHLRIFALQLLCGPRCHQFFEQTPPSSLLDSPVSHQELREVMQATGRTPNLSAEFMLLDLAMQGERQFDLDTLSHPDVYFTGAIDVVPRGHRLNWEFDLERALSGPLPPELWPPPGGMARP